ncbi:MAG: hypothetical protein PHU85_16590 [Phycisphaerae bacterium]|nr:hypothetical protein [Phycisphaerae bacterium]
MSVKNVLLIVLVLANMLLVTGLVLQMTAPQTAMAQRGPGGAVNYAVVAARMERGEDAVWILDLGNRKLYSYRLPQGNDRVMKFIGVRDVGTDLRNK